MNSAIRSLAVLLALLAGCSRQKETNLVTFPLRGAVVKVDTAEMTVTIAHQAIPNYMSAMTMPFHVKERSALQGLSPGDSITATLAVSRMESWLEGITVAGKGETPRTLSPEEITLARLFRTGETLPDATLLNQDGKAVTFSSFRGKAVALTFIYTRCPLPDYCIRMSAQFARIQKSLAQDAAMAGKWHLLSISFDSRLDRPVVLKRYAKEYGADLTTWDFLTDRDTAGSTIKMLGSGMGLEFTNDEGLIDHNLRTAIIDKEGKLRDIIKGNNWKPEEVIAELKMLNSE